MKNSKYPPNIFKWPFCEVMNNSHQHYVLIIEIIIMIVKAKKNKYYEFVKFTMLPFEIFPPNKRSVESDMAVESRRKTELTLIFSLKTSHGYGILKWRAFTEF